MLDAEGDQTNGEYNDASDELPRAPCPFSATKAEGDDEDGEHGGNEDGSDPIHLPEFLCDGDVSTRVIARHDEEADRSDNGEQAEIDVEGPSPGGTGRCKSATNDGAKNGANSPGKADKSSVHRALLDRGVDGDEVKSSQVDGTCFVMSVWKRSKSRFSTHIHQYQQ